MGDEELRRERVTEGKKKTGIKKTMAKEKSVE